MYMKSKQLTLIEESICLTILSVNSVYKVFWNVSITYILLQINSYFRKISLVGFQYEPVSLDVNEACFEEEQDIPNTCEKSRKSQKHY